MTISQEAMVEMIRQDVLEAIQDQGVEDTAGEYGVDIEKGEPREQFIGRCITAELNRCYA